MNQPGPAGLPPGSARARFVLPMVLAGLSMIGPFATDTPFPAFPQMRADFEVTTAQMQLVVSAYLIAFAGMSLLHGPLSDALGRRPVMIAGVAIFGLSSLAAAFAPNLAALVICRLLQGASAGGGVIVSRTVVRDLFDGPVAQRLTSRIMMLFGLGPAFAPVLAGWLLELGRWPVIFHFQAVLAVVLVALTVFFLPESHPPHARTPLSLRGILRSLLAVSRDSSFVSLAAAAAFLQAAWFLYITGAPIVVADLLHRGEQDYWMLFLPLVTGIVLGSWLSGRMAGRMARRRLVMLGCAILILGAVVNVTLVGVADLARLPYAMIGPAVMTFGASTAFPTVQLALLDLFPGHRGAAASVATFMNLALAAVFASTLVPALSGSLGALATGSLCLAVIALILGALHYRGSHAPGIWR